jgi:cytochrome P450
MISRRLAVLQFAAVQSSVITITNTIFDLAASPFLPTFISAIRQEIETELVQEHGKWNRKSLAKMTNLDSALKESMRLGGFVARGLSKLVMAPDGVMLPNGVHVPKGVKVGISQYTIHHDEDVYKNAMLYDALRFSRSSSESVTDIGAQDNKERRNAFVSTSPSFMAFSHGPHAW